MTLSQHQKKVLHAVIIAFVTGALTAAQVALTSGLTEKKALLAAAVGIVIGGTSRAVGALLAALETSDPSPPMARRVL